MRNFITAIGIAALLIVPSTAFAVDYTWTGAGGTSVWALAANWNIGGGYPGDGVGTNDTALINVNNNSNPVIVNSNVPAAVDWVKVDADTANAILSLEITTNGVLTVDDYLRLVGDDDTGSYTATLTYTAGTLDLATNDAALQLYGGNASGREAVLTLSQNLAAGDTGGIRATGYVTMDVATSMSLSTNGTLVIGDTSGSNATVIKNSAGTVSAGSIEIRGGSSSATTVTVNAGSVTG